MIPGEQAVEESLNAPLHCLSASNAVAALVVTEEGLYLLQFRGQNQNAETFWPLWPRICSLLCEWSPNDAFALRLISIALGLPR